MPATTPTPSSSAPQPQARARAGRRLVAPAMVGRGAEVAKIREALEALPAVVSVEGEAGVGKSRLVDEALGAPELAGFGKLVGRCQPIRESFPLGPVIEALREAGESLADGADGSDGSDGSRHGRPIGDVAGALRPLLPELTPWLPPAPEPLDDRVGERHRVFRGLVEVLQALAPVVLVLEDVHWADAQSIDFVSYLLADPPDGVAIVLTYRTEDADRRVRALTARLPRGTSRAHIALGPLSAADTGELAAAILGAERVSEDFTGYLWDKSSGLPFVVEEVIALARERGALAQRGGRWARKTLDQLEVPRGIRDATLERVAGLSPRAQRLVEEVAVLQTPAPLSVLAAMADTADEIEGEVAAALEEAVGRAVLVESDGAFGFRHALPAQAVYETLNAARRIALHGRAAAALRQAGSKVGGPAPSLGQIAHHLRHAGHSREWADAAEAAAAQAIALGNDEEAVRLLVDVVRDADLPAERCGELATRLGWAALETLHGRDVIELLTGVVGREVPAPARGELQLLLALLFGQSGEQPDRQRQLYLDAIPDLGHRPDLRAWAMVGLGVTCPADMPLPDNAKWLTDAVDVAEAIDDRAFQVFVLGKAGATLMEIGDRSWRRAAERVMELTGGTPRQRRESNAYYSLGVSASYTGHPELAETLLTGALQAPAVQGNERLRVRIECALAVERYCTGQWEGLAENADRLLREVSDEAAARMDVELVAGGLAMARGESDNGRDLLRRATESALEIGAFDVVPFAAGRYIRALLACSDVPRAMACVQKLVDVLEVNQIWAPAGWGLPAVVEALLAAGEQAEAARVVAWAAEALRDLDAPLAAAAVAHARGLLAGDADELLAAADAYERLPARYEAALARERAAELLLQGRDERAGDEDAGDERAAALLRRSLADYDELGAVGDRSRAAGLARRHGLPLPPAHRGGTRGYGTQLSPRERQVAELAARGRTNRQIAEELFLSINTINKQLGAVLHKLQAQSRAELAQRLVSAGANDGESW